MGGQLTNPFQSEPLFFTDLGEEVLFGAWQWGDEWPGLHACRHRERGPLQECADILFYSMFLVKNIEYATYGSNDKDHSKKVD